MPDVIPEGTRVNIHRPKKTGGMWNQGDVEFIGTVVSGPLRGKYRVQIDPPNGVKTPSGYISGWYPSFLLSPFGAYSWPKQSRSYHGTVTTHQ